MQNEKRRIQRDTVSENIFTECTEDFILPDYMPEIRRVLRLDTRILKGDSFIGGGRADFSGSVLYTLFYTDTEEKLTAVPLESRYEYHVPLSGEMPAFVYSGETAESVNMRPCGPRRVSIRTKIRAAVHAVTEEEMQKSVEELLPEGSGAPELLRKAGTVLSCTHASSDGLEAVAEWTLDGVSEDSIRPLYANAEVLAENVRAEDGHIACRGTVYIKLLLEKDGGDVVSFFRRVPFEEQIVASELREGDAVALHTVPRAVEIELGEEGGGVGIRATASYGMEALARRNEPVSVTTDMYLTDKELLLSYKPLRTECLVGGFLGNFTVEGEGDAVCEDESIPTASLSVRHAEVALDGGRATVTGELRADLICHGKEDGRGHFYAADMTVPFRIETDLSEPCEKNDICLLSLSPVGTEVAVQNGKRHLSTELSVGLTVLRGSEISVPDGAVVKERDNAVEKDALRIYYPTDKDSVWSVGKRYGVPTEVLQKQNGIPTDEDTVLDKRESLDGIMWLLL